MPVCRSKSQSRLERKILWRDSIEIRKARRVRDARQSPGLLYGSFERVQSSDRGTKLLGHPRKQSNIQRPLKLDHPRQVPRKKLIHCLLFWATKVFALRRNQFQIKVFNQRRRNGVFNQLYWRLQKKTVERSTIFVHGHSWLATSDERYHRDGWAAEGRVQVNSAEIGQRQDKQQVAQCFEWKTRKLAPVWFWRRKF